MAELTEADFYAPETPANIVCDPNNDRKVKAATLAKLLVKLTHPQDPLIKTQDFLLTYRSYIEDGHHLFAALKAREKYANSSELRVVRLKVFNVIKQWVMKFWYDFEKDCPKLAQDCIQWLDTIKDDEGSVKVALDIKTKLEKQLAEPKAPTAALSPAIKNSGLAGQHFNFLDVPAEDIAQQMTIREWKLWSSIKTYEFLNLAWTKKNKHIKAANLLAMIERFNEISSWVATTICMVEKVKDRMKVICKFIDIAQKLRALGNFNALLEIVSGFSRGPVFRLKETFALLAKKDKQKDSIYQELVAFTSSDRAYAVLRQAIKTANPPVLPYLGMYLTDLTFIEEGNKNFIGGLINFHKQRLIASAIQDILVYQDKEYNFTPNEVLMANLKCDHYFDDDDLFEISQYLEPRPGAVRGMKPTSMTQGPGKRQTAARPIDLVDNKQWAVFQVPNNSSNYVAGPDGQIVGMSLPKFIEFTTHHFNVTENSIIPSFLLSLHLFTTPTQIFDLLKLRFEIPPPSSPDDLERYKNELHTPIIVRIFNFLNRWISAHYHHFTYDPILLEALTIFIKGPMTRDAPQWGNNLNQLIEKKLVDYDVVPIDPTPMDSIYPDQNLTASIAHLVDFDPAEIARQLTLTHSALFLQIRETEWTCVGEGRLLEAFQASLTQLIKWVTNEIDFYYQQEQLVWALERVLVITHHCKDLNNWHGAYGCFKAMSAFDVARSLSSKLLAQYDAFREHFTNRESLLNVYSGLSAPAVLHLGPIHDIIQETNLKFPDNLIRGQLINFEKMKLYGNLLMTVQRLQKVGYNIFSIDVIQQYFIERQISCTTQQTSEVLKDLVLADPKLKEYMNEILQQVIAEETARISFETMALSKGHVDPMDDPSHVIADIYVRKAVTMIFPACTFTSWKYFDDGCFLSNVPQTVNMVVATSKDHCRYLIEIKEDVTVTEVNTLLKIGTLYKKEFSNVSLSAAIFTHQITDQATQLADRFRIRVCKI